VNPLDLSQLNPPQHEAVTHGNGPILVLAGAGSGKTRVITFRIANLVGGGIPPHAIAALTFTNKAAEEMRERVAKLVRSRTVASQLTMGTFHSLGLAILRKERKALGYPRGFVIYDTSDQLGVIRELLRTVQMPDRRFDAKAILTRISLAKNTFITPEAYQPVDGDEYDEITAEIYPRYQAAMKSYAALDFDDLITASVRLLDENEDARARWQSRFRYLMVDEYQDTNRAQLLMVGHLVAEHKNLCVVGDDDQSIYSWRGADPTNILSFEKMFPGARVVKLEQNYRSTSTILAAANAVIANNANRHGKTLWSDIGDGEKLVHAVASDVDIEAQFVVRELSALRAERSAKYSEFAILYRSNIQSKIIEEELRAAQIPYVMYGGQQFFERKEVKDLLAYLRLALNPRDEIALRRIINYPARGIGDTTLERISQRSQALHVPMWTVLENIQVELGEVVRASTIQAIQGFVALVRGVTESLEQGTSIDVVVRKLLEDIALYDDLAAAAANHAATQRRIDNVEHLIASLQRFSEKRSGLRALADYLRKLSLESESDEPGDPGNKVILTTLHGAKGLEFPIVFIIGMEEYLLPHARTLNPQVTDVFDPEHCSDVSEERRLAYVGITRAQTKLYLSRAKLRRAYGKTTERTPSRFLLEIPEELVDKRDVDAEAKAPVDADEMRAFFQSFLSD
jgi:superfamily I DNA/RNA helicase